MPRPPTIPERYAQAIDWCKEHASRWNAHKAALHLSDDEVAEMQARTDAADAAKEELAQARLRYRGAALAYRARVGSMRGYAAQLVASLRALARASDEPALVYQLAGLPSPDPRSPTAAPAAPTGFHVDLVPSTGALRVAFECKHPRGVRGVTYRVERFVSTPTTDASTGGFQFLTNAKGRAFADDTIPAGAALVVYKVTPQTSTRDGAPAIHMVRLAGEGVVVASELPARSARAA